MRFKIETVDKNTGERLVREMEAVTEEVARTVIEQSHYQLLTIEPVGESRKKSPSPPSLLPRFSWGVIRRSILKKSPSPPASLPRISRGAIRRFILNKYVFGMAILLLVGIGITFVIMFYMDRDPVRTFQSYSKKYAQNLCAVLEKNEKEKSKGYGPWVLEYAGINVEKTQSLISPYVGLLEVHCLRQIREDDFTFQDTKHVTIQFALQDGRWTLKDVHYLDRVPDMEAMVVELKMHEMCEEAFAATK